jgi:hypothetical protein
LSQESIWILFNLSRHWVLNLALVMPTVDKSFKAVIFFFAWRYLFFALCTNIVRMYFSF